VWKLHDFLLGGTPTITLLRFPLVFCAVLGLSLAWRTVGRRSALLYVVCFYFLIHALVFYSSERFRVGSEPFIAALAAHGAVGLWCLLASQMVSSSMTSRATPLRRAEPTIAIDSL
jgi:hypothetical protein